MCTSFGLECKNDETESKDIIYCSLEAVVVWVSLGGSLFSDWTHPITGEPIPRSNTTSLGGSLFSDWTQPITGEPIPRSNLTSLGGSLFSERCHVAL